jgi:hypothetical protein
MVANKAVAARRMIIFGYSVRFAESRSVFCLTEDEGNLNGQILQFNPIASTPLATIACGKRAGDIRGAWG